MINAKKLIAAIMAVATISTTTLAMSVSAAGNVKDTTYSFKVSDSTKYTEWREKLDKTSATIKVATGDPVIVRVYGNTGFLGASQDCTSGQAKVVSVSTTYTYLPNLVGEKDGTKARLGLTSSSGTSFTSSGVWSPDSV